LFQSEANQGKAEHVGVSFHSCSPPLGKTKDPHSDFPGGNERSRLRNAERKRKAEHVGVSFHSCSPPLGKTKDPHSDFPGGNERSRLRNAERKRKAEHVGVSFHSCSPHFVDNKRSSLLFCSFGEASLKNIYIFSASINGAKFGSTNVLCEL
jgi:hypothetical protein